MVTFEQGRIAGNELFEVEHHENGGEKLVHGSGGMELLRAA